MTPLRRRPGDDQFGGYGDDQFGGLPQAGGPGGQWPPQQHGYGEHPVAPSPTPAPMQGYHFPPPEPQPAYGGYSNPQALPPQQWPQHGEPQPFEINYQAYGDNDPPPFSGQARQNQGYADSDAEFSEEDYYEDEEPRRGTRWLLIAAALVGAIGVGGALAYTYRSLVAPKSRMEAVKTEPGAKVKDRSPGKLADEASPPRVAATDAPTQEDAPPGGGENQAPRKIKTIAVTPSGGPQAPVGASVAAPSAAVPGITLYEPPKGRAAKDKTKEAQEPAPSGRLALGTPPPVPPPAKDAKEEVEEPPTAAPPKQRSALAAPKPAPPPPPTAPPPTASPPIAAPPTASPPTAPPSAVAPRAKEASSGLGFVAVLKSEKTSIDAVKTVADLQQSYPDVLGSKSFDVQEADLSARGLGRMFRVVVGPPGSHNAAAAVCSQLKAAGYVGCWVKEW